MSLKCTYCGGERFLHGPEGGASVNLLCANQLCRHWFNLTPGLPLEDLHRVEPTKAEQEKSAAIRLRELRAQYVREFDEGGDLFARGFSARQCFSDNDLHKGWTIAGANAANARRLAGWVDAAFKSLEKSRA